MADAGRETIAGGAAPISGAAGAGAPQRIVRVRRQYNQWVANQTLEDYALRFTAKSARRWSAWRVANTALGSISFLALEAIGGAITLAYGFENAVAAILTVAVLIFLTGLPISAYAAKWGVDIDLLTRGAGFGYIGSTITSLIYASFTFIFFAIEAAILAMALDYLFGVPFWIGTIVSSLAIIPIVTHGITLISRFQNVTQPVWIVLQVVPFIAIAALDPDVFGRWQSFGGLADGPSGGVAPGFDLMAFGAASGVLFALVGQIGEQVDFLRFLPRRRGRGDLRWWAAMVAAGPGWIIPGALKLLAGSLLAVLALEAGVPADHADEPTRMYLVAFGKLVGTDQAALALGLTGAFILLAQVKINVTNAYAGSIAWSNFFSRLTHSHPGRVVWLIFNVTIAVLLMFFGIYEGLEHILGLYSIVAIAWVGSITADLVINRPLGLAPQRIEFRRAHLYDVNPVGLGAMGLAALAAMLSHFGALGDTLQPFAAFIALGVPMVAAPVIAALGGRRYYLARMPDDVPDDAAPQPCVICEYSFEPEDMARCPAYGGRICSLCCSLDARCHDVCKTDARLTDQFAGLLRRLLPGMAESRTLHPLGLYITILTVSLGVIGAALALVGVQAHLDAAPAGMMSGGPPVGGMAPDTAGTLWKAFAAMSIIAGVAAWLFVLARESRRVAQAESNRQTRLLLEEIEAHKATDAELQRAKEAAEAANLAKTRYVVGISHELRAPLNAIFGYAQILERDPGMPVARRDAVRVVRRSAEHLAGLIDGLLDISRIEAGHVTLARERIRLGDFLDQMVGMFSLAAAEKGIGFTYDASPDIARNPATGAPVEVWTDEKRLRQILINLLSNAVKFTDRGQVTFRVRRRSQVADFEIIDTGIGIAPADIARVFEPFERGGSARARELPGTGLGLTIAKLLTEILGGDITVTSQPGSGSRFRVRLFLSDAGVHGTTAPPQTAIPAGAIRGYGGRRRMVLVADDDPSHRALIADLLAPLDFTLLFAPDGEAALALAERFRPDLVLLDISMPDMDGWTAAREMRRGGLDHTAIVMVSADALIDRAEAAMQAGTRSGVHDAAPPHDAFVPKPVDLVRLIDTIGRLLNLRWLHDAVADEMPDEPDAVPPVAPAPVLLPPAARLAPLPPGVVVDLRRLAEIGYVRGLTRRLEAVAAEMPEHAETAAVLTAMLNRFELAGFDAVLAEWSGAQAPAVAERESGG